MRFSTLIDPASEPCASFLEAPGYEAAAANQVDLNQILSLDGPGFDDAIQSDDSGATVEVARSCTALGAQLPPNIKLGADLVKARARLAGKASEPLKSAWYTLGYRCWEGGAKISLASEQLASWFTDWDHHAGVMQGLAGCS